jgi:BspA type Leucine rich repeat region (6 copies)
VLLLALPAVVQAQFNFTTNNGALTITQYNGSDCDVAIPNTTNGLPVTTIGSDAFFQSENLTSVEIGTNVTTIADNAFFQCFTLTSVSIPASVTNIGQGPFFDCQSLTAMAVSAANTHYTNVNGLLFNKAQTSLIQYPGGIGGSYTLPAAVTNVGEAFIGNTLTTISNNSANLFYSTTNGVLFNKNKTQIISYPGALGGSYTNPSTVTIIVGGAFEYSTSVASITIGSTVTNIGDVAFYDCASLTAITVNPANLFYSSTNGVLFDKKKTQLIQYPIAIGGSYTIPATVTDLAEGAFGDALNLTDVVIPNSVTNIGFETFYNCPSLSNVTIGSHLVSIAAEAFFLDPSLTDIVIPASVTSIGAEAFGGCEDLSGVCFEGKPPTDGGSIFLFDDALTTILFISGTAGWGSTYDGITTAPCSTCGGSVPQLAIIALGANVILAWSADFSGFILQSATNLVPPVIWGTVSPVPVIINNLDIVTNAISGTRKFYRLSQ